MTAGAQVGLLAAHGSGGRRTARTGAGQHPDGGGRQVLGLQRDPLQIASCFVTGAIVELLLARVTRKHAAPRLADRLLSASVAGVSTLVLLRSEHPWFYALAVAVAKLRDRWFWIRRRRKPRKWPSRPRFTGAAAAASGSGRCCFAIMSAPRRNS